MRGGETGASHDFRQKGADKPALKFKFAKRVRGGCGGGMGGEIA